MGKSAVAEHFLDELIERGEALVLRGRAYERESVPYKAVDSVVDALSRYLVYLEEVGQALDSAGRHRGARASCSPFCGGWRASERSPRRPSNDPNLVRRRAFAALRALLATLAAKQPLVIYVDDAQWGDADSAALLLELVRPPDAPPRSLRADPPERRGEGRARSSRRCAIAGPRAPRSRDIAVGPLAHADAQRLALALLDGSDDGSQRMARAAARESQGSPFLVEELVRHNMNLLARLDGVAGAPTARPSMR